MPTQILKGLLLWLLFAGSVFITSGKFVDPKNAPKFYFVVVFILVLGLFIAIKTKAFAGFSILRNRGLFWGIFAICFMEALLGLAQYTGLLHSNHSKFAVTGSFDNPAGLAAVLSIAFPFGLLLYKDSKTIEKHVVTTGLFIIAISVVLSGSRAGMLSILISLLFFQFFQPSTTQLIRESRIWQLSITLLFFILIGFSVVLYQHKMDSANGRLLIWKVSAEMIKDKPVLGHGHGSFQAKYMAYQAEYFRNNPGSKFELLADNVKHPFNEFVKIAVEFGIVGLIAVISLLFLVFWRINKLRNGYSELVLCGLIPFLVFANFSYPFQYVAVWLLLASYLSMLLPARKISIKNTSVSIFAKGVIVVACVLGLIHLFKQIRLELKWKTIAVSSLNGNTEEMLPEYEKLYATPLKHNPFFLYNYGAELNYAERYDESNKILVECSRKFNDYDLQLLLADNYTGLKEYQRAEAILKLASEMIPNRFIPLYQLVKLYQTTGQNKKAVKLAHEIMARPIKIPSPTINSIKREMNLILNSFEITYN